tara:strand:+ start:63 stop:383 length:321 start_codon:yes stop_codon:yes gene_type:complete
VKIFLQLILAIISISLQLAVVVVGWMLIVESYIRAIESETVIQMALWLTATKFVFFSPIYVFKTYVFLKSGEWGEEESTFLPPIKTDILIWSCVYLFFTLVAFLLL